MSARLATRDDRILAGEMESVGAGLEFGSGYLSPFFITDPERMEVLFENGYVLIHEKKISFKEDLAPLLKQITKTGKPLLIIAEDVADEVLAALVVNKVCGALQVAAVRAPGVGDRRRIILQDIARITGTKAITDGPDLHLKNIQMSDLGRARKITINKNNTVVEGIAQHNHSSS